MHFPAQHTYPAAFIVFLSSHVAARGYEYVAITGTGAGQSHNEQVFEDAARTPLMSNDESLASMSLDPSDNSISSTSQWTWNLNLTNVKVDDASIGSDAEVTSVVYDLSLNPPELPARNQSGYQLCATVFTGTFPTEFDPLAESDSGDCRSIVGDECLSAWQLQWNDLFFNDPGSCQPPPSWSSTPECGNLSNVQVQWSTFSLVEYEENGIVHGLKDRQPFYFSSTAAHSSSESKKIVAEEAAKIRMLLITRGPANSSDGTTTGGSTAIINDAACQRLKTGARSDTNGTTGQGNDDSNNDSSNGDDSDSAAVPRGTVGSLIVLSTMLMGAMMLA